MQQTPAEDILSQPPAYKLYKENHIVIATFLGSPVIGGYLIGDNFRKLGKKRSAWTSWIIATIATGIIFASIFLIPGTENLPSYVIPLIYVGITRFLVQKYQAADLRAHEANSGQFYSVWRAVGISLISLVLLLAIIFTLALWADTSSTAG
jgi:ABC-type iron transport system FetAB permease component